MWLHEGKKFENTKMKKCVFLFNCYTFFKGCNIADILHTLLIYPYKQNYMSQITDLLLKYSPVLFNLGVNAKMDIFTPKSKYTAYVYVLIAMLKGIKYCI